MPQRPFNLILLGDPGAGKTTQAALLTRSYPLREFDFGAWLRSLKSPAAKAKYNVHGILRGELATTGPAQAKFRQVIMTTPKHKGVFFSGNPRMIGEAKEIRKAFKAAKRTDPLVLYLGIPKKEMMQRIELRRSREGRSEDAAIYLKNRLHHQKENVLPTLKFLKAHYMFKKIDGTGTREEVFRRLKNAIETYTKNVSH